MVQVKYIALSIGLTFCFSSCVTKTDDTAPALETLFEGEVLLDSLTVEAGEELDLIFKLSDESGLNTARFFISKKSEVIQNSCVIADTFEYLSIIGLTGNTYDYNPSISLSDTIIGVYSLEIGVYDDDGNVSDEDYILSVQNQNYPVIDSLISEDLSSGCIVSLSEGNLSFEINVQASCVAMISEMKTYLIMDELPVETQSFEIGSSLINSDVNFNLPQIGQYELKIELISSQGVSSWAELEVNASS